MVEATFSLRRRNSSGVIGCLGVPGDWLRAALSIWRSLLCGRKRCRSMCISPLPPFGFGYHPKRVPSLAYLGDPYSYSTPGICHRVKGHVGKNREHSHRFIRPFVPPIDHLSQPTDRSCGARRRTGLSPRDGPCMDDLLRRRQARLAMCRTARGCRVAEVGRSRRIRVAATESSDPPHPPRGKRPRRALGTPSDTTRRGNGRTTETPGSPRVARTCFCHGTPVLPIDAGCPCVLSHAERDTRCIATTWGPSPILRR